MADQTQSVTGPDGKTYDFPSGTTKDQAISYFKKKGIGAQPQHMPGNTGGSSGSWDAAPPEPTGVKGVAAGFLKPVAGLVATATEGIGNTIQKLRGKPTLSVDKKGLEPANTSQAIGGAVESAGEYMAGEAGLKALTAALKVKNVAAVTALVAKYPRLAKIAEEGMKAAGIGTTLAAAHGEEHPVQAGITTGVFGAGGEAASQTLSKVAPAAIAKSRALMNRYIGLTQSDLPKWSRFKAGSMEDIGKTVIEKVGVKATLPEQYAAIETVRDNVETQTDHMLSQVTGKLVPLHANLQAISNKLAKDLLLSGRDSTGSAIKALNANIQEFKGAYNPNLTVQESLELRRNIGKQIKWNQLATTDDVRQMVMGEMYSSLNESIENALPSGIAKKFAENNKLQQRLIIAREAAGEKINKLAVEKGPGAVSRVATIAKRATVGAAIGGAVGAATGGKERAEEEGGIGALIGAVGFHGQREIAPSELPASDIRHAQRVARLAPRLAQLAKKSPMAARAIQSITDAHGGGSGALAAQN